MGGRKQDARHNVRVRSAASADDSDVRTQLRAPSSVFVHIVDDDGAVREALGDLLRSMDYQVILYASASDFLKVELPDAPACLVLDVRLPGTSGLDLQAHLASINVGLPVILMTGQRESLLSTRPGIKVNAFLEKPFIIEQLLQVLSGVLHPDSQQLPLDVIELASADHESRRTAFF